MWIKFTVDDQLLIGQIDDNIIKSLTEIKNDIDKLPTMVRIQKAGMIKFKQEPNSPVGKPVVIPLDEPRTSGETFIRIDKLLTITPINDNSITVKQLIDHYSGIIQVSQNNAQLRTFHA